MKLKLILALALIVNLAIGVAETPVYAANPRKATTKQRTSAAKRTYNLPGAIGSDKFITIKRKAYLKYVGPNPEEKANYQTFNINIKWPTDLCLAGTGGSGNLLKSELHNSRVEEIQALIIKKLFDDLMTSDIKKAIDEFVKPTPEWEVVASVPQSAYSSMDELVSFPPIDTEIKVTPYLSCNKWICFEVSNTSTQMNGCDGRTRWVIIPRNQSAWNRLEITFITALDPGNYTTQVASKYGSQIMDLIKTAAVKDGSIDFISDYYGRMYVPDAIRAEKDRLIIYFL